MDRRREPLVERDLSLMGRLEYALGAELTSKICSCLGGTYVCLSVNPRVGALVEMMGVEAARKLYKEFGYGNILIPMGIAHGRVRRRQKAEELERAGQNRTKIARELGVHVRTLNRWLGPGSRPVVRS